MALQYVNNILIADLTLTLQPEQYTHRFRKLGSYKRTIGGSIVDVNVNGDKLIVKVSALTQDQVEAIKRRCALKKIIVFRDYIPIAEKNATTRTIVESLGSEVVDSETIYLYIPEYSIIITEFERTFGNNIMSYSIIGEEV